MCMCRFSFLRFGGGKKILFPLKSGWRERKKAAGKRSRETGGRILQFVQMSSRWPVASPANTIDTANPASVAHGADLKAFLQQEQTKGEVAAWSPGVPREPLQRGAGTHTHTLPLPCKLPISVTMKAERLSGSAQSKQTDFIPLLAGQQTDLEPLTCQRWAGPRGTEMPRAPPCTAALSASPNSRPPGQGSPEHPLS